MGKSNTLKRKNSKTKRRTYKKRDYESPSGMLTSVWGPALWHYLHVMSFNYPVKPSIEDKRAYKNFILN